MFIVYLYYIILYITIYIYMCVCSSMLSIVFMYPLVICYVAIEHGLKFILDLPGTSPVQEAGKSFSDFPIGNHTRNGSLIVITSYFGI
jgi:hypothetical protein